MDDELLINRLTAAFGDAAIHLDSPLTPDLALGDITELDSISRARLMVSIEEAFEIEMPLSFDEIETVGDLLTLIRDRIETKGR